MMQYALNAVLKLKSPFKNPVPGREIFCKECFQQQVSAEIESILFIIIVGKRSGNFLSFFKLSYSYTII